MQLPVEEIECRLRKAGVPEPLITSPKLLSGASRLRRKSDDTDSTTISQSVRRVTSSKRAFDADADPLFYDEGARSRNINNNKGITRPADE